MTKTQKVKYVIINNFCKLPSFSGFLVDFSEVEAEYSQFF